MNEHDGGGARSKPGRLEFERAIRRSDLPPPSRHLALTIATWADIDTGIIADRFQPSMNTLLAATGMSKGSMLNHLDRLEADGWIVRDRPDVKKARAEHARTHYSLTVPPWARGSDPLGLGQELTQPRSGDDLALGQEMTQGTVRSRPRARSGADPKSPYESHESQDSSAAGKPDSNSEQQEQQQPGKHQVADDLTAAFWKLHGKGRAQTFIVVRQIIRNAIGNGVERDDLARALERVVLDGYSISGATLDIALGKIRNARGSYQNTDDQSEYDEDLI